MPGIASERQVSGPSTVPTIVLGLSVAVLVLVLETAF